MIHQDQKSFSEYNEFTQFALLWEIPKNLFRSHCIRNDGAANVHEQGVSLFLVLFLHGLHYQQSFFLANLLTDSRSGSHKITRCCCSNFWLLLWLCLSGGSGGRRFKLSHQDLTQFWQRIKVLLELSLTLGALISWFLLVAKVASLSADEFDTHGPPQSLYVLLYQCV